MDGVRNVGQWQAKRWSRDYANFMGIISRWYISSEQALDWYWRRNMVVGRRGQLGQLRIWLRGFPMWLGVTSPTIHKSIEEASSFLHILNQQKLDLTRNISPAEQKSEGSGVLLSKLCILSFKNFGGLHWLSGVKIALEIYFSRVGPLQLLSSIIN